MADDARGSYFLQVLISLTTLDNDYQQEPGRRGQAAARCLGVSVRTTDADNDAIKQAGKLVETIQSPAASRPAAIVLESVGTPVPKVPHAAAAENNSLTLRPTALSAR